MKINKSIISSIILVLCVFSSFSQIKKDTLEINFDELIFSCNQEKNAALKDFENADSIIYWTLALECKE